MKKSLIDLIDSYDHSIFSLGLKKSKAHRSGEIKFEGGGWILAFMTDRYYSDGLIINLIEVGAKEYSLSILKEAVKEFECDSIAILREQGAGYVVTTPNHEDRAENIEERVTDLINFFVKKFEVIKKNQMKIDAIYDRLAKYKLHEIGLRFVGD